MTIKRISSNALVLENSQDKSLVTLKSLDGQILVKVSNGSTDVEISKPGDYEYFGTNITAFEVPIERYLGVINLVRVVIEGVVVTFLTKYIELPKEILTSFSKVDIFLVPSFNNQEIKSLILSIEPKKLVVVKSFDLNDELDIDGIKKVLGLTTLEEVNSIKSKSVDFDTDGDTLLVGEILT